MKNLINVKLTQLIGINVEGLKAQVRNPEYVDRENGDPPLWRTLKKVITFTERGKEWVELYWYGEGERCTFTGCTIERNSCTIQMEKSEFNKIKK